ncbi:DUF3175 domain-containing protein [Gluconacetobacter sacchari]|uniref:DUF3175 domain-containing protein n=2 Tax=Gluconacetobacter sacchari TaxID=92759 RepID=A0A7W4IGP6_9PROT|nr:DUF3175 domain-containing protein [Gluconacetobacter sacchari]MBB2162501.1 DUF3175 domain-containing protein [Gluconacetobacter sacchari]GBQ32585.1 hypothetical protein AA12717_4010 [Gluconacetobacter sacchari DSM 12717]
MTGMKTVRDRARTKRWSGEVTRHSDALDIEPDLFKSADPHHIAESLKHSAETSTRRKTTPFRSAMSMLVFYINRAGRSLSPERRDVLGRAKQELRRVFGRPG